MSLITSQKVRKSDRQTNSQTARKKREKRPGNIYLSFGFCSTFP